MGQDLRYAFRVLVQNPGFAAVAILSLALGIGANSAIFTLIEAVMWRRHPVRAPEQLVVAAVNPADPNISFNYPDYEYIRGHNRSFSGVIATDGGNMAMAFSGPGGRRWARAAGGWPVNCCWRPWWWLRSADCWDSCSRGGVSRYCWN